MQIIETTFNNFRCFKEYTIKYGTQTTVFIGKNGTGKSSILSGLRRGLSFMFAKPKKFTKNIATSNGATVKSFGGLEFNFDSILKTYNTPLEVALKANFQDAEIKWSFYKEKMSGAGLKTKNYEDALNEVLSFYNSNPLAPLPVLALYADSFPHVEMNVGALAKKIIYRNILPRDFAYYGWIDKTNCTELWLSRFFKVSDFESGLKSQINETEAAIKQLTDKRQHHEENDESKLNNIHRDIARLTEKLEFLISDKSGIQFNKERKFIEDKFMQFTSPIQQEYDFINREFELYRLSVVKLDGKKPSLQFSFKDGRTIAFETLPMGYKRIFSIVLDLAYRCFILNEDSQSQGIVMIDEVELHLHPTLQQEILQRLKNTFPEIQFIVTTHSPLVISNFKSDKKNKIIKLMHVGNNYSNEVVENIYGIDYSTGLTEVMGAKYRASNIDNLINSIVILTSRNRLEDAEKIKEELYAIVGENNAHIKNEIDTRIKKNKK